ncbi:hypothetical protein Tco_0211488 [Tanacetum coccineum]
MVTSKSTKSRMYTFSPMMVANSQNHHCCVRTYTREVLVLSTNLEIQTKHCPLVFRNRRADEARIKKAWYNQGFLYEEIGIQSLLGSNSCGSKVLSWRNHLGENEVVLWTLCKKSTLAIITWRREPKQMHCPLSSETVWSEARSRKLGYNQVLYLIWLLKNFGFCFDDEVSLYLDWEQ